MTYPKHPNWVIQLEKAPRTNVIVGATALTFGICFFVWSIQLGSGIIDFQ